MSTVDTQVASATERPEDASVSTGRPSPEGAYGDAAEHLVPVGEAIRYRKRAQQAEQQFNDLQRDLEQTRKQLAEADALVTRLERRQRIDQLLADAEAVDLQAARLLTEAVVAEMDEPDIEAAVDDLRRHKPYLFGRSHLAGIPTMGAGGAAESDAFELAQDQATASGHRRDLLRYLRLRRAEHRR